MERNSCLFRVAVVKICIQVASIPASSAEENAPGRDRREMIIEIKYLGVIYSH